LNNFAPPNKYQFDNKPNTKLTQMPRVKTNEKRAHSTLKAAPTHNIVGKNQNYGPGPTSG
jgi:hypothetical protein